MMFSPNTPPLSHSGFDADQLQKTSESSSISEDNYYMERRRSSSGNRRPVIGSLSLSPMQNSPAGLAQILSPPEDAQMIRTSSHPDLGEIGQIRTASNASNCGRNRYIP